MKKKRKIRMKENLGPRIEIGTESIESSQNIHFIFVIKSATKDREESNSGV